jgi:hypothetical protein
VRSRAFEINIRLSGEGNSVHSSERATLRLSGVGGVSPRQGALGEGFYDGVHPLVNRRNPIEVRLYHFARTHLACADEFG